MVLNVLWVGFFFVAFVVALIKLIAFGDLQVFSDMAKVSFDICLGLTGALTLWLRIMKVGERGGAVAILGRAVQPFFRRLLPELPRDHPVYGSMILNFAANMLGLDNAATPLGLKAMQEVQELNPDKDRASSSRQTKGDGGGGLSDAALWRLLARQEAATKPPFTSRPLPLLPLPTV